MDASATDADDDYYILTPQGDLQIWSQDIDDSFVLVWTAKPLGSIKRPSTVRPSTVKPPTKVTPPPAPDLISLLNQARKKAGSPPLKVHPSLEAAARDSSANMASKNRIMLLWGRLTLADLARKHGYRPVEQFRYRVGPLSGTDQEVLDSWLTGTKGAELLDKDLKHVGYAVATSKKQRVTYYTLFVGEVRK